MRIECPNCRRVCAISGDLIVTEKRALGLSCSICKADFHIQLSLPAQIKSEEAQGTSSSDSSTRLHNGVHSYCMPHRRRLEGSRLHAHNGDQHPG